MKQIAHYAQGAIELAWVTLCSGCNWACSSKSPGWNSWLLSRPCNQAICFQAFFLAFCLLFQLMSVNILTKPSWNINFANCYFNFQAVPLPAGARLSARNRARDWSLSWGPQRPSPHLNKQIYKYNYLGPIWRSMRARPWSVWQTRSRASWRLESSSQTNQVSTKRGSLDFGLKPFSGGKFS